MEEIRRQKIVFFTGAGISAAAGIPTFRDEGGLWMNHDPELVCSSRALARDRWTVAAFHNELRRVIDRAEPTAAHREIASLEKVADVVVVTQNVDDLHERAGSTNIIKLHGDIHTARLKRYRTVTIPWNMDIERGSFPEGFPSCLGTMRHDVVLFGEKVRRFKDAERAVSSCDVLIVCGTSLSVFPAAELALLTRCRLKILLDPNPSINVESAFNMVIKKTADDGLQEAIEIVRKFRY